MPLIKGYKQLMAEASRKIRTLGIDDVKSRYGDPRVVFVDIRDVRELEREGMIPGAFHAPRGMLEFWVDPDSPYFKEILAPIGSSCFIASRGGVPHWRRPRYRRWDWRAYATSRAASAPGRMRDYP